MSWIKTRSGSRNFPAQLRSRPGRIAYLGASVTVQQQGYRPLLHFLLIQHFGRPHLAVNAGVGGVGVMGGVLLMDDLVIAHRPDYCFVEFSTADYTGPLPLQESAAALEGVFRKLAAIDCRACLLHLYRADLDYPRMPAVVAAFEEVAEAYQVPSLHVGHWLGDQFEAGHLTKELLYSDLVHTTPAGANHVAETVFHGLRVVWEAAPAQPLALPTTVSPLHPNHCQFTALLPADQIMGEGEPQQGRFREFYDYVQVGFEHTFVLECADTLVGMVVVVGPDAGVVEVVSPLSTQRIQLWDPWCHYDRLQTMIFWPNFAPGTPVRVRLIDVPIDYGDVPEGSRFGQASAKVLKVIGFVVRR